MKHLLTAIAIFLLAVPANAQHEHRDPAPEDGWAWSIDTSVFLSGNLQVREFRDFHQVESQNWLMAAARRRLGTGSFSLHGMFSFEPFTLRDLGSAQAFQTGETFDGAPLIDYQHPHDLIMGLAAAYERLVGTLTLQVRGGLVDAPALGPTPFMHRASALLHPTAPLAHHQIDSTHISHGVITGGLRRGPWQAEASVFHGREPDEDRLALELGALDSFAVRGSWIGPSTRAQLSVGWLDDPHAIEPGDIVRLTASIEHARVIGAHTTALTIAWGQNRGDFASEDGLLAEASLGLTRRATAYLRGEIVEKHILEAGGLHPPGLQHPHVLSTIKALTLGYQHAVYERVGTLSIGADLTAHATPANLLDAYGNPRSIHVYVRWALGYSVRPIEED